METPTDGQHLAPTLTDIAEHAGVSVASVSRVLNGGSASASMRHRVESAMAELGYVHNGGAPLPKKSTPGSIAVLISDILNPYFAEMLRGVEDETETDGWSMMLITMGEDQQREERALRRVAALPVDGVILSGSRLDERRLIELQERCGLPFVLLNRHIKHPEIVCILVDLERSTYRAAQHLINMGHTRVGYLAGPGSSQSSQLRRTGLKRALAAAALSLPAELSPSGFPNTEGGFQSMSALLALRAAERPTAVFAYNDMMALGALSAIRAAGLRVPEDISVIGFDDVAIAAHANPPLTTIAQPKYQMGKLAVRLLRQIQRGEALPTEGYLLLESPFIVRQSTAPVAAAHPLVTPVV